VIYLRRVPENPHYVEQELALRVAAAYDDNGVDRSLVRASLALTPTERLARLEDFLEMVAAFRRVEHESAEANS
jgi:hypothetical protein